MRHRCQDAPGRVAPIASVRPRWASEVTRATPDRPRAVRSRKNPSHPAPSSAEVTCRPRISRCPSALTPVASRACTPTTRPPSLTFSTSASAATNVYGPASSGRVRKSSTTASSSAAITETCDLDSRVMPSDSTSFSIRRVETPSR